MSPIEPTGTPEGADEFDPGLSTEMPVDPPLSTSESTIEEDPEDSMHERLLAVIEQQQAQLTEQQEKTDRLAAEVERLNRQAFTVEDDTPTEFQGPPPVPEGAKRYWSEYAEHLEIKTPGRQIMINGVMTFQERVAAEFSGHVFQTADPEMIEFLDTCENNGRILWEDPLAVRNHSLAEVDQGVRGTESQTVRRPSALSAPMS